VLILVWLFCGGSTFSHTSAIPLVSAIPQVTWSGTENVRDANRTYISVRTNPVILGLRSAFKFVWKDMNRILFFGQWCYNDYNAVSYDLIRIIEYAKCLKKFVRSISLGVDIDCLIVLQWFRRFSHTSRCLATIGRLFQKIWRTEMPRVPIWWYTVNKSLWMNLSQSSAYSNSVKGYEQNSQFSANTV
jgi:hypothetical protein